MVERLPEPEEPLEHPHVEEAEVLGRQVEEGEVEEERRRLAADRELVEYLLRRFRGHQPRVRHGDQQVLETSTPVSSPLSSLLLPLSTTATSVFRTSKYRRWLRMGWLTTLMVGEVPRTGLLRGDTGAS